MYTVKNKLGYTHVNNDKSKLSYEEIFNQNVLNPIREFNTYCYINDLEEPIASNKMMSMSIEYDAVNGNNFDFGCLSCAKLSLTIKYDILVTRGDILKPVIEMKVKYKINNESREEWIPVPLGHYIVSEIKDNNLRKTIDAYDRAFTLDEDDIVTYPNYNNVDVDMSTKQAFHFPCKIKNIIDYINNSTDFTKLRRNLKMDAIDSNKNYIQPIIDVNILNGIDLESTVYDLDENMTLRKFIGYLAGLQAKNAMYDRDGKLAFRSINNVVNYKAYYDDKAYSSFTSENTDMKVDKLICETVEHLPAQGENEEGLYTISLSSGTGEEIHTFINPLVNQSKLDTILSKLLNGKSQYTYKACKAKMKGDPRLDINDFINFKVRKIGEPQPENISIPIMKMKMNLNNNCAIELESVADLEKNKSTNLSGSISSRVGTLDKTLQNTTSMAVGMFKELYGSEAKIGDLYADNARLGKVLADKVETSFLFADDATIKEAHIGNISADKITAGTLRLDNDIVIGSGDGRKTDADGNEVYTEDRDTLSLTSNSIVMRSPEIVDGVHNSDNMVRRLFIGKRYNEVTNEIEYVIEIYKEDGKTKLWGAEGLTSEAVNGLGDKVIEGGVIKDNTVTNNSISSVHATKVMVDESFSHADTNKIDGHTSLYNYLKHFDGDNLTVKMIVNEKETDVTLQYYLDNLEDVVIKGLEDSIAQSNNNSNTLNGTVQNIINKDIKELKDKDKDLQDDIDDLNRVVNSKVSVGGTISDINSTQSSATIDTNKLNLSGYAKETFVDYAIKNAGYLKTIPSEYITESELSTELEDYATKTDLQSISLTPNTPIEVDGVQTTLNDYVDSKLQALQTELNALRELINSYHNPDQPEQE